LIEIITDSTEAIALLREKLTSYLEHKGLLTGRGRSHFYCPFHNDKGKPNMSLNPHSNNKRATCFSCSKSADIFDFAEKLDGLPNHGEGFFTTTLPALGALFDIKIALGPQSETSRQKALLAKLMFDISSILVAYPSDYGTKRGWSHLDKLMTGSCSVDIIKSKLLANGWDEGFINDSRLLSYKKRNEEGQFIDVNFIDKDKFTFVIQDPAGRPIGLISRQMDYDKDVHQAKYIHSFNSLMFQKSKCLFGLHADMKTAKEQGVYIVEGPGDLAALHSAGHYNVIAVMGVALTTEHLYELKKLGIKRIVLCLDSDEAGQSSIERFIDNVLSVAPLSCSVKLLPAPFKDVDEYLKAGHKFANVDEISVFTFKLERVAKSTLGDVEAICEAMVPIIANEASSIKRSLLVKELNEYTSISVASINMDVESSRSREVQTINSKTVAAAKSAVIEIERNPSDAVAILSQLNGDISKISTSRGRNAFGPNNQLSRFTALQEFRNLSEKDANAASFQMTYYKRFLQDLSGGMPFARKSLCYCGGKANHGKTLFMLGLASDVAISDPDAMVIIHSIDDAYERIEPRIKANLYNIKYARERYEHLTMDMVNSPYRYKETPWVVEALQMANNLFQELLSEERLVLLDGTDGRNLSFLETAFRYYRDRFPTKKVLSVCDNTHDYEDFPESDATVRMKKIASRQKQLAGEYDLCMFATVEYKKLQEPQNGKMRLPEDDDIADSRAMSYKPDMIYHIYNDMAARKENAEVFWKDERGARHPRLMGIIRKNKITAFKGNHAYNIIPGSIMLEEVDEDVAAADFDYYRQLKEQGADKVDAAFEEEE
jgi:DNA primase catalytic core